MYFKGDRAATARAASNFVLNLNRNKNSSSAVDLKSLEDDKQRNHRKSVQNSVKTSQERSSIKPLVHYKPQTSSMQKE